MKNNININILVKKIFIRVFMPICIIIAIVLSFVFSSQGSIYVRGSTTVQPLMLSLGSYYKKEKFGENVSVSGGGSTQGINFLLNSLTDIGSSSRFPKLNDSEYFSKKWENDFITCPISLDIIIFAVNISNLNFSSVPDFNLSTDDIINIYNGKYTKWSQIDKRLPDNNIVPINREDGSGTRSAFYNGNKFYKSSADNGSNFPKNGLIATSNGQVVQDLLVSDNTIGYFSLGYLKSFFANNGESNNKINDNIFFPNITDGANNVIAKEDLIKNASEDTIKDFSQTQAQKINNSKEEGTYAYWHPMNLIINKNNKIFQKNIFNSSIDNNTNLMNWIYNPNTKVKDNSNNYVSMSDLILNFGYLPMYFPWGAAGKNSYYYIPYQKNGINQGESQNQNYSEWFNIMQKLDHDREETDSDPWWQNWIGKALY